MFCPPEAVVFTMWHRGRTQQGHNFFQEVRPDPDVKLKSQQHVRELFESPPRTSTSPCFHSHSNKASSMFGLGSARSLKEFYEWCDVDFTSRNIGERAKYGFILDGFIYSE